MKYLVQIGTNTILDDNGAFDADFIDKVAAEIAALWQKGERFAVIPGGGLALGYQELGWGVYKSSETNIADLQHASAVGQPLLMAQFYAAFARHNLLPGQFPYTHEQLETPSSRRKIKVILDRALDKQSKVVPIILGHNVCNDEEIKKVSTQSDYDTLWRVVANLIRPDRGVFLTKVEGIRTSKKIFAKQVNERGIISHFTDASQQNEVRKELMSSKKDGPDGVSSIGMLSKFEAAEMIQAFTPTWIVNGRTENVLLRIHQGEDIGTMICLRGNSEKNKLSRS